MSRITCKTCRRLGESVCGREKCAYKKRPYTPGKLDSEKKRRSALSEYGEQLRAKQKMRITYGLIERQFATYVKGATLVQKAVKGKDAVKETISPSLKLYRLLEGRLDNIVYRSGIANTRALARQLVNHGHVTVNGRKLSIPSHQTKVGDVISIREGSKVAKVFVGLEEKLTALAPSSVVSVNPSKLEAKITGLPREVEPAFDTQKVLEYYSR